jgi:hypothetical protein
MSPARRTCAWKFRADGLLLPYECLARTSPSRTRKSSLNLTFEPTLTVSRILFVKNAWSMKDDADPLYGWSHSEYIAHATAAKNDVYGAFFKFLRSLLMKFRKRLQRTKIMFRLFAVDAVKVPGYVGNILFDRIDISYIRLKISSVLLK